MTEQSPTKTYQVILFDRKYIIENSTSRSRAVTEAIGRFRKQFPDSPVPASVLRSLAKTSAVEPESFLSRKEVEEIFGGKCSK